MKKGYFNQLFNLREFWLMQGISIFAITYIPPPPTLTKELLNRPGRAIEPSLALWEGVKLYTKK